MPYIKLSEVAETPLAKIAMFIKNDLNNGNLVNYWELAARADIYYRAYGLTGLEGYFKRMLPQVTNLQWIKLIRNLNA
jgi:hypothetical protein